MLFIQACQATQCRIQGKVTLWWQMYNKLLRGQIKVMFSKPLRQIFVFLAQKFLYMCSKWNAHIHGGIMLYWELSVFLKLPVGVQRKRHGMSECMPFSQLHGANYKISTEVILYEMCDKTSQFIVELSLDWLKSGLCSWRQMWANILAHHFSSVRPKCFRGERASMTVT